MFLVINAVERDAIVEILLSGRWPDRPARDPLAAVTCLQNLAIAAGQENMAATPQPRRGRTRKPALGMGPLSEEPPSP